MSSEGFVKIDRNDSAGPARLIHVSNGSTGDEADPFWAQTGGGDGNFGVITRYYFETLPDAPDEAVISTLGFDWDGLTVETLSDLLGAFAEIASRDDNRELQASVGSEYFNSAQSIPVD